MSIKAVSVTQTQKHQLLLKQHNKSTDPEAHFLIFLL